MHMRAGVMARVKQRARKPQAARVFLIFVTSDGKVVENELRIFSRSLPSVDFSENRPRDTDTVAIKYPLFVKICRSYSVSLGKITNYGILAKPSERPHNFTTLKFQAISFP